ncbi:CoA-binding protein [Mangrovimonas sp. YM274]|uniref:CoA-binding protein n=1 Tax=Mangrovimonas sp. YM274 TaxID=3070660 RepID=UPI0027DC426D|nr:CoA-binding protein [Mangrovimonas sp. YM274]WMI69778.1 CoA-binding protein [Mangrovimonas sp. YM274]
MTKKTLVFGASLNPSRYSNFAIGRLLAHGHEVVAYGIKKGSVADVKIDDELLKYDHIDTVTLYLNPSRQSAYYDYLVSLSPKRIIFNPGTENPELYQILEANNIGYEVACTLVLLSTNQY